MKVVDINFNHSGDLCKSQKAIRNAVGIYESSGHLIIVEIYINLRRHLEMLWRFMKVLVIKSVISEEINLAYVQYRYYLNWIWGGAGNASLISNA